MAEEILKAVRLHGQMLPADARPVGEVSGASLTHRQHAAVEATLREIAKRIGVQDPSASRRHVKAFTVEALKHASSPFRRWAVEILKDRLGFVASEQGTSSAVRRLRQEIFRGVKVLAPTALASCFGDGELEGVDLYGVDFSAADLRNVSFRDAFLVEADFGGACLDGADLTGSYLRNANFVSASLANAKLTDADWFNAVGFTESQFAAACRETVADCPGSLEAMRAYLRTKYGFPLETWDTRLQAQLHDAWRHYLGESGLCALVASWRR